MITKLLATCSSCGEKHEVAYYSGINTAEEPELKTGVKNGSIFLWECPHCGKTNLASGQTIYHDPEEKLMVWLLPPGIVGEDKVKIIEDSLIKASEALEGYTFRRVDDVGSLIEKVNIHDAGLDDIAIEMCKYVTKMELAEKGGDKATLEAPFKFFRIDGPDNELSFTYPADGHMQVVQIGFNVYEDCAGIIRRNPALKPSGGFPRIDQGWIARFFR